MRQCFVNRFFQRMMAPLELRKMGFDCHMANSFHRAPDFSTLCRADRFLLPRYEMKLVARIDTNQRHRSRFDPCLSSKSWLVARKIHFLTIDLGETSRG